MDANAIWSSPNKRVLRDSSVSRTPSIERLFKVEGAARQVFCSLNNPSRGGAIYVLFFGLFFFLFAAAQKGRCVRFVIVGTLPDIARLTVVSKAGGFIVVI